MVRGCVTQGSRLGFADGSSAVVSRVGGVLFVPECTVTNVLLSLFRPGWDRWTLVTACLVYWPGEQRAEVKTAASVARGALELEVISMEEPVRLRNRDFYAGVETGGTERCMRS